MRITIKLLIIVIIVAGLGNILIYNNIAWNAKRTFKVYIADPIPQSVKILKGRSVGWQGFVAGLVFTADKNTIETLVANYDYLPDFFGNEEDKQHFNELQEWLKQNIPVNSNLSCYRKIKYYKEDNPKAGRILFYMFWDKVQNKVYFYGLG